MENRTGLCDIWWLDNDYKWWSVCTSEQKQRKQLALSISPPSPIGCHASFSLPGIEKWRGKERQRKVGRKVVRDTQARWPGCHILSPAFSISDKGFQINQLAGPDETQSKKEDSDMSVNPWSSLLLPPPFLSFSIFTFNLLLIGISIRGSILETYLRTLFTTAVIHELFVPFCIHHNCRRYWPDS